MQDFPLFPEQASTIAPQIDALYFFLVGLTGFFTLLIFVLVVYFAIKYRRRGEEVPKPILGSTRLELTWSIIPFAIVMVIFGWGTTLFYQAYQPPPDAMDIYVIGKQWMWKIQHPDGRREINELTVPVGQPVRLIMASQDVIHSFSIPAFRVKMDVLPGRYTSAWFEATRPGVYHLFCTEYCGTLHSGMVGRVVVLEQEEYQRWLAGAAPEDRPAVAGEVLFDRLGCITCHGTVAPSMSGLYGSRRLLTDGREVIADEAYLRRSILDSTADIVAGYGADMPSYRNQISEEQLVQLIAYIKSLAHEQPPAQREQRPTPQTDDGAGAGAGRAQ